MSGPSCPRLDGPCAKTLRGLCLNCCGGRSSSSTTSLPMTVLEETGDHTSHSEGQGTSNDKPAELTVAPEHTLPTDQRNLNFSISQESEPSNDCHAIINHGAVGGDDPGLDVEPPSDHIALKSVGPDGGTLSLPAYGVRMFVPLWALKEETAISMQLLDAPELLPKLDKEDALVCPGVICRPSGMKFATPIRIVFPHCVRVSKSSDVKLSLYMKSENDAGTITPLPTESNGSESPRCLIRRDTFELFVDHFSIIQIIMSQIAQYIYGKRMSSTPYLPREMSRAEAHLCHLRVYNDNPGLESIVEKEEEKLGYSQCAPTHKIYVEWDKGDVKIQCEITNASLDASERIITVDDIYRYDRNTAYFLLSPTGLAQVLVRMRFEPHSPDGHVFHLRFKDGTTGQIADTIGSVDLNSNTSDSQSHQKHASDIEARYAHGHPVVIPHALRHELSVKLNREGALFDNWKRLAVELGLEEYIDMFEQKTNPADEVIRTAEIRGKIRSLDDLKTVLERMDRHDCAESLNNYYPEKRTGPTGGEQFEDISECLSKDDT